MDKIWDRKSFEVGVHWPLWRGWKTEWPRRTDKSRTLKKYIKNARFAIMSLQTSYCEKKSKSVHHNKRSTCNVYIYKRKNWVRCAFDQVPLHCMCHLRNITLLHSHIVCQKHTFSCRTPITRYLIFGLPHSWIVALNWVYSEPYSYIAAQAP